MKVYIVEYIYEHKGHWAQGIAGIFVTKDLARKCYDRSIVNSEIVEAKANVYFYPWDTEVDTLNDDVKLDGAFIASTDKKVLIKDSDE